MNNRQTKKTADDKKGGRKPKGGKIISKTGINYSNDTPIANIILHLKCSLLDLDEYNENYNKQLTDPLLYNPIVPPEIKTYNKEIYFKYEPTTTTPANATETTSNNQQQPTTNNNNTLTTDNNTEDYAYINTCIIQPVTTDICSICSKKETNDYDKNKKINGTTENTINNNNNEIHSTNEINQKLKNLKIQLFKNTINEKKSACFWCTYDFDNIECYIPSYENNNTMYGYGSFCRPECAVAYLMEELIDDSIKFERYNLINQIYGKIYNYKKNIKPAPNPYYSLDKFYGNLTIQEYRKLLKSEHLLMIVEKPLTRILPELHEENDDFGYGNSGIGGINKTTFHSGLNSNELQYKVKKSNEKKNSKTKTSIIREHFGLA